jgi:hypothetical protein
MGRAGGVNVGLIERITAKSTTTKPQGYEGQEEKPLARVDWEVPKKA